MIERRKIMTDGIKGYAGFQLRIQLERQETRIETVPPEINRKFLGGAGYAAKLLYDEMAAGIDPLSPENILVLATGPLSLNQAPGGGSIMVCFKSPLTGVWGQSRVGGNFGPDLKRAGFDYVVIEGRAAEPVYILIDDGRVEFHSAQHLLGLTVTEKSASIREALEDPRLSILCIGPAGENLVKISAVMSDDRAAGRCGGGAVWGSKNLIAVAVRGTHKVEAADPQRLKSILQSAFGEIKDNPMFVGMKEFGTIGDLPGNDDSGDWPTRNWKSNSWGKGAELFDHYQAKNFLKGFGCYRGCALSCARRVHVAEGEFKTPEHGGAEYESISCFTAYVLNEDMDAAIHSTYLCNEYGLDTISCGAVIAFGMECVENGLFSAEELQGLDLRWGNSKILPVMVKKIALREGIGNVLAEGVRQAARLIGCGAEKFAIHVKGLEGAAHDPRSGKALGVTYATANRGMCHIQPLEGMAWDRGKLDWGLQKYGVPDPNTVERWDEKGKGAVVQLLQNGLTLPDVIGTCKFYMYGGITIDHWASFIAALTGWDFDGDEILQAGERAINIQRLFNCREGITAKDDFLPERVRAVPESGKYAAEPDCAIRDLEGMLQEYYHARGWDPVSGAPLPEKLAELGLP
jgi:aldehyde:ferredoxin oxidoreductase